MKIQFVEQDDEIHAKLQQFFIDTGLDIISHKEMKYLGGGIGFWYDNKYKAVVETATPYKDIFGRTKNGHYLLYQHGCPPVRIECHGQQVGGTCDEKVPCWIENMITVPEDSVLILDGDGWKSGVKEYAVKKSESVTSKRVRVFGSVKEASNFLINILIAGCRKVA